MEAQSNQPDTSILEYDQLPTPPELNEALLNQLDTFIKGRWSESQQCITMIRSICKYYPQYIPDIFTKYGPAILDLFGHSAPQLLKNILKMLKEVFDRGTEVNLQGCVNAFLPVLAKKAAMESGYVKQACQQVLTIIATKCCYCNTIEITTQLSCCDKNVQIGEIAIKMLAGILSNIGGSITQINPNTLQIMMKGMSYLIRGKRNNTKTNALEICLFIYNQIGNENYLQLMNYSLSPQEIKDMTEAMESRIPKAKTPHLHDVLKQQKMQNSQRPSGAWGQNVRM